jgi:hypothetical protein
MNQSPLYAQPHNSRSKYHPTPVLCLCPEVNRIYQGPKSVQLLQYFLCQGSVSMRNTIKTWVKVPDIAHGCELEEVSSWQQDAKDCT